MKRGIITLGIILLMLHPSYAVDRNVTEKVALLNNGPVRVRFHNLGVDANWGKEILENAAKALPLLEDYIGVDFPKSIGNVEIFGIPEEEGNFKGYNVDGKEIVMIAKYPANPCLIYHELTHYWTIHYHVPWALSEGYSVLYSYLVAKELGQDEIAYDEIIFRSLDAFDSDVKEKIVYIKTENPKGTVVLNSFDYRQEMDQKKIEYFYGMSAAIMFTIGDIYEDLDFHLYGIGLEELKEVNKRMMSSNFDEAVGGIGTLQYIELLREMTGKNMSPIFLPAFFSSWDEVTRQSFETSFSYLTAAKTITGSTDANIITGMKELAAGNTVNASGLFNASIKAYYEELAKPKTLPPTPIETPAPVKSLKKIMASLLESTWFIPVVIIIVILAIFGSLGFYLYMRSKREEAMGKYLDELRNE